MQKHALIFILLFLTGCSVTKRAIQQGISEAAGNTIFNDEIKRNNLSCVNFKIDKAVIDIKTANDKRRIVANMKYNKPGIYLISVRNSTGIEAARIYINKDTLLINDRINKKLYYGSPEDLLKKYGISFDILPVLIGDYINDNKEDRIVKCENNKAGIPKIIDTKEVTYIINCSRKKLSNISIVEAEAGNRIGISFERFKEIDSLTVPGYIKIQSDEDELMINIELEKIEITDINEISFIPGKNYEAVLLK